MTLTRRKLIGNHILASCMSKLRNEITPIFFTTMTHATQTEDWMHKRKKFMEKLRPETTNCEATEGSSVSFVGTLEVLYAPCSLLSLESMLSSNMLSVRLQQQVS